MNAHNYDRTFGTNISNIAQGVPLGPNKPSPPPNLLEPESEYIRTRAKAYELKKVPKLRNGLTPDLVD